MTAMIITILMIIVVDHHERKLALQLGPRTGGAEGLGIEDDVESCPGASPQTQSLASTYSFEIQNLHLRMRGRVFN